MTRNQERALAALIGSPTQEAAAAKAGITSRTLRRYLQDPEFSAEYERLTGQLVTGAALQAQKSLAPALNALLEIATDSSAGMGHVFRPHVVCWSMAFACLNWQTCTAELKLLRRLGGQYE